MSFFYLILSLFVKLVIPTYVCHSHLALKAKSLAFSPTYVCHSRLCMSFPLMYVIPTYVCHSHLCMSFPLMYVIPANAGISSMCNTNPQPTNRVYLVSPRLGGHSHLALKAKSLAFSPTYVCHSRGAQSALRESLQCVSQSLLNKQRFPCVPATRRAGIPSMCVTKPQPTNMV